MNTNFTNFTDLIIRSSLLAFVSKRRKNCQLSIINYQLKNSASRRIFLVALRSRFSPIFLLASILPDKVFGQSQKKLYLCVININNTRMTNLNQIKLVLFEKYKKGKWLADEHGKTSCTVIKWWSNSLQLDLQS